MRHMDETLLGRQHDSMSHRISFRQPASRWRRTAGVAWQALGYAAVMVTLILALVGFGD